MKPRVLHLITSFEVGGTERQAVELLKRIDRRRFDVRLGAVRLEGPLYPEVAALFPLIPQFPLTSFYNANAAKQLMRLRNWMISERVNILHAHDFYTGLLGAAAGRLAGVRVIACQRHMRLSDRRAHEWGTRLTHRLAHRVLVNSEAIRDHLLAAGRIAAGEPKAHFLLIGDGALRREIEEQAARVGVNDRVHLLGPRNDAALIAAGFDVAVSASLHEGLPNAVMEAMAAGAPVVATAVGGTTELVIDDATGFLAPPANAEALAHRILSVLRNPGWGAQMA